MTQKQVILVNDILVQVGVALGRADEGKYSDFVVRAKYLAQELGISNYGLALTVRLRVGRAFFAPDNIPVKVLSEEDWLNNVTQNPYMEKSFVPMVYLYDADKFRFLGDA